MEWQLSLLLILGSLLLLMAMGMPVAFCFMLVNVIGVWLFWGGGAGLEQLIFSLDSSVSNFYLLPLPLFILMGEVIYHSGIAPEIIGALDKWLGRLPGRLGLLAVAAGTVFSALTGASMGSVAMLGSTLVPEMEKRGYKKPMSLGPILGSGGLAIMIPPSGQAVLLGAIGEISIGKILIAIIIPGLIMAVFYAAYVILRCWLQPSLAPAYEVPPTPLLEKSIAIVRTILPVGFIVFMVIGVILLGIATPTEAAATGALGCFILCAVHRRLNWELVKKSVGSTLNITVMVFMIIVGATAFSQILAFSGAAQGLLGLALSLPLPPILIIAAMMVVVLFLGMVMSTVAIMMICLPIFVPVVHTLGFDTVWFAVLFLLSCEMGVTSPPFGLTLFVMKGVAPPDTTMEDCYRAALPFLYCDAAVLALLLAFPATVLWLPGIMR